MAMSAAFGMVGFEEDLRALAYDQRLAAPDVPTLMHPVPDVSAQATSKSSALTPGSPGAEARPAWLEQQDFPQALPEATWECPMQAQQLPTTDPALLGPPNLRKKPSSIRSPINPRPAWGDLCANAEPVAKRDLDEAVALPSKASSLPTTPVSQAAGVHGGSSSSSSVPHGGLQRSLSGPSTRSFDRRTGWEDQQDDDTPTGAVSPKAVLEVLSEGRISDSWLTAASSAPLSPASSTFPKDGPSQYAFFTSRLRLPPECADSASQRHALNLAPLPRHRGSVMATLRRQKGSGLFAPARYLFYIDGEAGSPPVLLAVAQRPLSKRGTVKPYYIISSSPYENRFDRSSPHFLARLMGNVLGTHYLLHGRGADPAAASASQQREAIPWREEYLEVRFKKPTDAPRTMEVAIPRAHPDGTRAKLRPLDPETQGLAQAWSTLVDREEFQCLCSPPAVWDEHLKGYSMNFYGRVGRASAKNFQLAPALANFEPDPGSGLCMQFGRQEDDCFNIDIGHPLSPLQTFALGLSMFDHRPAEKLRLYY